MKKTRKQMDRQREQDFFVAAVTLWIVVMVGLILYKAVNG